MSRTWQKIFVAFLIVAGLGMFVGRWPDHWNGFAMCCGLFMIVVGVILSNDWFIA
jgi:hypothetical protein